MEKNSEMEEGRFIKQKNTMIVWDIESENRRKVSELIVYEYTDQDIQDYKNGKIDRFRRFTFITGRCNHDWNDKSREDLICYCLKILIDFPESNTRKILLQIGKILELEAIRKMVYFMFAKFKDEMTFEEFISEMYPPNLYE